MIRGTLHALAWTALLALGASCSDSHPRNQQGGETHFMKACPDGTCEGGLSCVCGVCTHTCTDDEACEPLGGGATCRQLKAETLLCGAAIPVESICDSACYKADDCESLGSSYACVEGRCRPEVIASMIAEDEADAGSMDAAVDESDASSGCTDDACGLGVAPLVMIIVDTSGSMERKTNCVCETPSCEECLPNCGSEAAEKNRWAEVLEVLTGTYEDFQCDAVERVAPAFIYDLDYGFPYHRPSGTQREDGVLRMYAERLRFGIATFDGVATYAPERQRTFDELDIVESAKETGLWSYPAALTPAEALQGSGGAAKAYRYPNCANPYFMNTGIRSPIASSGALIVETAAIPREETVHAIESTLRLVRPFGSTPIAASLDDVQWLFANDTMMSDERRNLARERHLILITDGQPDDDYRLNGCDCFADGDGSDCGGEPNIPSEMRCPYPLPEQAARTLRCGESASCDSGFFDRVHVVGFALESDSVVERMNEISRSSGAEEAILVNSGEELRAELGTLLANIAEGRYRDERNPTLPRDPEDDSLIRKPCAPARVQLVGACDRALVKYYWNGFACVTLVGCECAGLECDRTFDSIEECLAANEECEPEDNDRCRGEAADTCDPDEYCELLPARCGVLDPLGTCQRKPTDCDGVAEQPVCGCDGEGYANPCEAALAEVGIASFGACSD